MIEKALLYVQNYKYWYSIPKYFSDLIPKPFFNLKTESFKDSFFSYTVEAWCSLDPIIINSKSLEVFKST